MRSTVTRLFVTVAMTASVVLCASFRMEAASSGPAPLSCPVEVDANGAVLIPVTLNSEGPFLFILDTGATSTAVADTLARRLKLTAHGKTLASTAAGSSLFDVVTVAAISASHRDAAGLNVVVMPAASLARIAPQAAGILGQDVLRQSSFTIDYERARFSWVSDRQAADRRGTLTLKWSAGRWLVRLPQDSTGERALWMVADSGASAFVFFDRGTPLALHTAPLDLGADVQTMSGATAARGVIVRELRAGAATLRDRPAVIVDRPGGDADSDGLLPLCAFARVTFDVSRGTMRVEPRR